MTGQAKTIERVRIRIRSARLLRMTATVSTDEALAVLSALDAAATRAKALDVALRTVLKSATPHPTEHPTMWKAWGEAAEVLGEPADNWRLE